MTQLILDTAQSVKLSGAGNGQVQLGPGSGQMWQVTAVSVSTASQAAPYPQCNIYAGPQPQPPWFVDGTYTGNLDSTGRAIPPVYPGSYIWAVWSGGNPNDTATVRITGTIVTGYRSTR